MQTRIALFLLSLIFGFTLSHAQSPATPVVIQAANQGVPVTAAAAVPAAQTSDSSAAMLKALLEMKSANQEVLKKQGEALQLLDDIETRAEQLKIYTKRG
ncbi:MAG: hypothetical protein M3Y69_03110 [Verrucomicrobiota bacterium]|nr:hypothetical protein [Verrucomicrobiota bacterium]